MSRLVGFALSAMFLLLITNKQSDQFSKYKKVEAYEVRPGILMMPRYAEDGQVCEIGLERWHFLPQEIDLDSDLLREKIDQIALELAPANERGPRPKSLLERGMIDLMGNSMVSSDEYENISIKIYGPILPTSKADEIDTANIVATITWKKRKCQ
jgi:hypothetical protein